MVLTKTIYHKQKNQNIAIEFQIEGNQDYDELNDKDDIFIDYDSIVICGVIDEDLHEEVNLDNVLEIVEDWVDKNYRKLQKEILCDL